MPVKLHSTSKYPTSLIVRGADQLGVELARSLLEQGGYVIMVDYERSVTQELVDLLSEYKLFTLIDFTSLTTLEDDLRRLDYVFYLQHKSHDLRERISSQEFLQASNYLDSILDLTTKFEAKFLLTTSIRAHQLTMSGEDADISSGFDTPHSIYTDVEIQRYSEGLVSEYQEKVGIDSRIVRLGELLGKGMNVAANSKLVELIHEAIRGENLHLPGDGLDADYYIHYLDAAYGLLKAQFSMNTRGKTFTLANDEEVTLLTIAYKLLEIEPAAQDIVFDQQDNELPPIKLYKPAPNLNTIGWRPRVSLERSLAQSVDYLRSELDRSGDDPGLAGPDEDSEQVQPRRGGFLGMLRDFFLSPNSLGRILLNRR